MYRPKTQTHKENDDDTTRKNNLVAHQGHGQMQSGERTFITKYMKAGLGAQEGRSSHSHGARRDQFTFSFTESITQSALGLSNDEMNPWKDIIEIKRKYYESYTTREISEIILMVSSGLNYLHGLGISHTSISSSTIVMKGKTVKLIEGKQYLPLMNNQDGYISKLEKRTSMNSFRWASPELFTGMARPVCVDIFAVGTLIWTAYAMEEPFERWTFEEVKTALTGCRTLPIPGFVPFFWGQIMTKCWAFNQDNRPSIRGIVEDIRLYINESVPPIPSFTSSGEYDSSARTVFQKREIEYQPVAYENESQNQIQFLQKAVYLMNEKDYVQALSYLKEDALKYGNRFIYLVSVLAIRTHHPYLVTTPRESNWEDDILIEIRSLGEVDREKGYERLFAMKELCPSIQYLCGLCAMSGWGTSRDEKKAFTLFLASATQGCVESMCSAGLCFLRGRGIHQNTLEGLSWLEKAAEGDSVYAHLLMGRLYEEGSMVEKNAERAVECFLQAAQRQSHTAQLNLANCYKVGIGIMPDKVLAAYWYRQSASRGNPFAQLYLGNCFSSGEGVEANTVEAIKCYQMACGVSQQISGSYRSNIMNARAEPHILEAFARLWHKKAEARIKSIL